MQIIPRIIRDVVRRGRRLRERAALPAYLRTVDRVEGMIAPPEADLLYHLAREVSEGCIVEVGSYRGRSTTALALGSIAGHEAPVFAIDPHEPFAGILGGTFGSEDRKAFFSSMGRTGCYRVVRLVNLSSEIVTPGWKTPVALLWIDGDHTYEGVKRDFEVWSPFLMEKAMVLFDDAIDPRIGPFRLIEELVKGGDYEEGTGRGKVRILSRASGPVLSAPR